MTWVDATHVIRDVAPLAGNRQILGLTSTLPEPKRVARLAREGHAPVYTRPFEAIQGRPSFEVWVPVFRAGEFTGLLAGVYSCVRLLQEAVPPGIGPPSPFRAERRRRRSARRVAPDRHA